jgi:uncharacterized membrane protein YbhN (UPF0104 family)
VNSPSPNRRKWLLLVIKLLIVALVVAGIARELYKAQDAFAEQQFSLASIDYRWLMLAGIVYLAGMLPMGLFWHVVLRALDQRPRLGETLRAFYIGHLGKYVPGKAMVVVLRTGLVRSERVDWTVAGVSVFTETLTMMAVGAFLASVILAVLFAEQWPLLLLGVGLMICAGVPTLPPIFRRLVYVLRVRKLNPKIGELLRGLTFRVMAGGWLGNLIGWLLLGVSLWATLCAMPGYGSEQIDPLQCLPLVTATVCLAIVAGFLSLLPGGVLVREYIVMTLLAPVFGPVTAIVSAVLLRVVWMAAEVLLAGVLYFAFRSPSAAPAAAETQSAGGVAAEVESQVEGTPK